MKFDIFLYAEDACVKIYTECTNITTVGEVLQFSGVQYNSSGSPCPKTVHTNLRYVMEEMEPAK